MAVSKPATCLHSFFFARLKGKQVHKHCRLCDHRWIEPFPSMGGRR
jgi:hypothetical protein